MMSETLNFSFFDCAVPVGDCLASPPAGGDCATHSLYKNTI